MFFENGIVKAFNLLYNNGGDTNPQNTNRNSGIKKE